MDKFQIRYLAHQERKKKLISGEAKDMEFWAYSVHDVDTLYRIMMKRRSRRLFTGKVSQEKYAMIDDAIKFAPSSCNRKAIEVIEAKKTDTLVGGKGWIDKAEKVYLFYANMLAYKSPNEVDFMPYLDTGFIAQNIYLMCEALNIKCCFVNPNNTGGMERDGYRFCGAMAIGK